MLLLSPRRLRALLAVVLAVSVAVLAAFHQAARAQSEPIRLEVSNGEVAPGDDYQLQWMERAGVTFVDDVTLEECSDASFSDSKTLQRYSTRSHHKKFENNPSATYLIRYYRVHAKASVRGEVESTIEEVYSNTVRVVLLGTNKALRPPELQAQDGKLGKAGSQSAKTGKNGKDDTKKADASSDDKKDEYPTAGRPDLTIQRILMSPEHPRAGETFYVLVQVRNKGVVPSPPTSVQIDLLERTFSFDIDVLKPNAAQSVTLPPLRAPKTGSSIVVRANVDPNERVVESREDNNVREVTFTLAEGAAPPSSASPASGEARPSSDPAPKH
jgi:CARDB